MFHNPSPLHTTFPSKTSFMTSNTSSKLLSSWPELQFLIPRLKRRNNYYLDTLFCRLSAGKLCVCRPDNLVLPLPAANLQPLLPTFHPISKSSKYQQRISYIYQIIVIYRVKCTTWLAIDIQKIGNGTLLARKRE